MKSKGLSFVSSPKAPTTLHHLRIRSRFKPILNCKLRSSIAGGLFQGGLFGNRVRTEKWYFVVPRSEDWNVCWTEDVILRNWSLCFVFAAWTFLQCCKKFPAFRAIFFGVVIPGHEFGLVQEGESVGSVDFEENTPLLLEFLLFAGRLPEVYPC